MSLSKSSINYQQNLTTPNSANKKEKTISLKPKVVETLVALVERRSEVIAKDELMNRLWADSFVEESNLTQNIYLLRKTLGKCADGQPFIETFSRRGYRFNGKIKTQNAAAELLIATRTKTQTIIEETIEGKTRQNWLFVGGTIVFGGLLILSGILFTNYRNNQSFAVAAPTQDVLLKRLTPDVYARYPLLSPDGKRLAFTQTENGKNTLWLKDIETGGAMQLLPPISAEQGYYLNAFSPDGHQLFYEARSKNTPNMTIVRLTLSSGEMQEIARDVISPAAISPDGSQLAFIKGNKDLMTVRTDGSGERFLKHRESGWFVIWGSQMSWSPDGTRIAVCGGHKENGRNIGDLIEVSASDGNEQTITTPSTWLELGNAAWLADGKSLFVTARQSIGEPFQIWQLSYPKGTAERITNDNLSYEWLSISADSQTLAAEQELGQFNIWTAPLNDSKNIKKLTFGNSAKDGFSGIAFMPDGRIVYSSTRSGNVDLWMMNADGSNQTQLTANAGNLNGRPQVTPDGRYIVFVSSRTGANQIWRMETDGGNAIQLTNGIAGGEFPGLAPDGQWIFYNRTDEATPSIWKVSLDGGEPLPVSTQKSVAGPLVSPDGKLVAYYHNEPDAANPWQIGVMPIDGGESIKMYDIPANRGLPRWTADSKSLITMSGESNNLWEYPLDGGQPRQLTNYQTERNSYFAFSPNFKQIAFSRGNDFSEAVLINLANR
jgi:Tol biopolymer transport system component/DNA-binding winged helix-turn-helix (wHTH) protein